MPGEYKYVSRFRFWLLKTIGAFCWTAYPHGNSYGTTERWVVRGLKDDNTVYIMILTPDAVIKLENFAKKIGYSNRVFPNYILSPPQEILRERLRARGDKEDEIEKRLKDCVRWDSEARKFKLSMTIAHQYIGQLGDDVRKAVFGNVGTIMSFRIGPEDASAVKIFFDPTFSEQDLVNIENFNAYTRLMINGKMSQPFNFTLLPPEQPNETSRNEIISLSRQKYSPRTRDEVLKEANDKYFVQPPKVEPPKTYEPSF